MILTPSLQIPCYTLAMEGNKDSHQPSESELSRTTKEEVTSLQQAAEELRLDTRLVTQGFITTNLDQSLNAFQPLLLGYQWGMEFTTVSEAKRDFDEGVETNLALGGLPDSLADAIRKLKETTLHSPISNQAEITAAMNQYRTGISQLLKSSKETTGITKAVDYYFQHKNALGNKRDQLISEKEKTA